MITMVSGAREVTGVVSYTPEQQQAIFNLDQSLVVTAGAGSGKTRVLVGRYVNILDQQAADIDEVIAITFTEKAASEMKGRAWEAIVAREKESCSPEEARRWRELARRLQSARISTIDSFCAQLVRDYPVEAGVDPEFVIMDEFDAHRALLAAARSAVDKMLQRKDPYLTSLAVEKGFGSVAQGLIRVYERMRMTGRSWKEHLSITVASLDRSEAQAEQSLTDLKSRLMALAESGGVSISVDNLQLGASWLMAEVDAAVAALKLKKRSDEQKEIDQLTSVLQDCVLDRHAQDGARSVIDACALMDEEYRAQRGHGALVDFTGIEIAARDLLRDTPAGEACRSRFKFVLVDEYQDTNRLQDEIISRITGDPYGNRRFLVGDPKQSIYRFRGAVVEVFEEAVRAAGGDADKCRRVELGTNFRSVGPLVDVTNALFTGILGPERFLPAKSHRRTPSSEPLHAELMLAYLEGREKSPRGELEAEIVARRIADMVDNGERLVCEASAGADEPRVTDRPVRYGDIAVLLRAMTRVKEFEAALARSGIPYYVVAGTGFYGRPEVMWLMDLLRAVDDRSDVTSLAAVLRSPVFGLSDESLLRLKTAAGGLDLAVWGGGDGAESGVVGAADALTGVELDKFHRARACLTKLGTAVGRMTVGGLMKAAIELAGFEEYFAFAEQGAQSIGNLRKLVQMAEDEASTRSCLRDFIVDMDLADDLSAREAEAAMEEESADTVKIMTVHKSKGLEFPVVFLPELAREARRSGGGLFEYSLPLGLAIPVQVGDEWCDKTRHSQAVADEIRAGDDEEGKRCLYVAATRASDYLVMSATLPGPGARARSGGGSSWYEHLSSAIPGLDERGACGADGAGGADAANTVVLDEQTGAAILVRRYEESAVRRAMRAQGEALAGAEDGEGECEGESADISEFAPLVRPVWSVAAAGTAAAAEAAAAAGGATAACAPCQFSVSALMCFSHCPRWYLYEYVCRLGRIPRDTARAFGSELQLNAAVRGQIVHSACERCGRETDLAQARALVLEELRFRGVRRGRAEAVADELMPMIDTFLLRYPGLAREGDKEVGFLMDLGGPVVSGVMDRVDVQADGSVLVVDLKTNRVRGQAVDEAMARYGVQLDAYAVAAGRVHGTDCVTARLHFLYPDEVRERSYGPDELREAAEKLKELAVRAARHDLRNTPIQRIAECDRCYFAPLCGIVRGHLKAPLDARELHEVREASFDEEVLPVISLSDDEYLDLGGVGEVDYD